MMTWDHPDKPEDRCKVYRRMDLQFPHEFLSEVMHGFGRSLTEAAVARLSEYLR
jgi:hypothetical protein